MDWRIRLAIETMKRDMDKPLGVPELARRVNLSASHFSHLFRTQTGRAPGHFLHELRLERARLLVETSVLSIKEIMARVGFSDPSHFARDFKRHHGFSPRSARRAARATLDEPSRKIG